MRLLLLLVFSWAGFAADFSGINREAERLYAEKSFAKAHDLYAATDVAKLTAEERRWVEFRRADTLWRANAGDSDPDEARTAFETAEKELRAMTQGHERADEQDRIWAEAEESLGQLLLSGPGLIIPTRRGARPGWGDHQEAWEHIGKALGYWAGSRDVELARKRYISLTWWCFDEARRYGAATLAYALENVAKIATAADDKGRAHYLLAQTIAMRGNAYDIERIKSEYEAVIAIGKSTKWYSNGLFSYAQWLMYSGRTKWDDAGNPTPEPNRKKALEMFRRIVAEFKDNEESVVRPAREMIKQLEAPVLNVTVSSMFLPNSTVEFDLNFKNVRQVEFTLRRVELTKDFQVVDGQQRGWGVWGAMIPRGAGEVVKRWTKDFSGREEYQDYSEPQTIEGKLGAGAYLIEATGGGISAHDLILVTDVAMVATTGTDRTTLFVCNAQSGAPIAGASVKLLESFNVGRTTSSRSREAATDASGLAEFAPLDNGKPINQAFALVNVDGRPGITMVYPAQNEPNAGTQWKTYIVTDRPAYRPGETVHWKITARRELKNVYTTPAGTKLTYMITDPRGQKVKEGEVTLNSFGSAWDELALTPEMTLGQFQIVFNESKQSYIGAGHFRLEEYKLPEFKVTVQTPEENGRPKAFRLGEKVEVTVKGEYYFGGAVANASVHVVVRTNTLYHIYRPERAYPWFFENFNSRPYWRGQGEIALEKDLATDGDGKAMLSLETAQFGSDDVEFTIEARMTDASRREIVGNGTVRVTKHRYEVHANPKHWLHRPNDKAEIEFRALDANEQGVVAEGKVKVTRDYWYEIWEDAAGREVKDAELKAAQAAGNFPPAGWKLKFRGYEKEDVTSGSVKTDAEGKATFAFTPVKEGYYRVTWLSEDKRPDGSDGPPIKGETTLWVANDKTTELGYRHGDLEIILDKDTFRAGQKASVMLHTAGNDRWVMLAVVTDRILRREVVHMTGTVKLLELDIADEHGPNFWIQAVMVRDGQIHRDQKEVVVPPVKHFLDVQVAPDKSEYRARDEGKYVVTAKDFAGKPVSAEVEFGVIDEAVFYIQKEYAGDPRQFFFGEKRYRSAMMSSTFDQRAFRGKAAESRDGSGAGGPRVLTAISDGFAKSRAVKSEAKGAITLNAAPAPAMAGMMNAMEDRMSLGSAVQTAGVGMPEPVVRSDFRSTIYWQPDLKTDADGTARVTIKYPDSVTTWKATARAATTGSEFGVASASTHTTQPIIVRLQAPRFFVVGDQVTISAVINNNSSNSASVMPEIAVEGLDLSTAAKASHVTVAANGEVRVDWRVVASKAGEAKIRVTGKSSAGSDSMERTFTVFEHGIEKFLSQSGKMNASEAVVKLDLPARRKDSTRLVVQVTPSLAVTMLDALPYLLDYPYGCTEQTMSRFLPAAIIAKTLSDVGIDAETAMGRAFGGIEAANAAKTQPKGKRNLQQLNEIVQQGLERLRDMQHADGGWGWWKEGESDAWMTAYVVWGLALAQQAKLDVGPELIETGSKYLTDHLVNAEGDLDLQAWMLHACAASGPDVSAPERKAIDNIWAKREQLKGYSRALFAMALHAYGDAEKARVLVGNLENGVRRDENSGSSILLKGGANLATAHWGANDGWWHWSEGPVETTAFALRALMAIDPQNKLIEPASNWLVKNRRGAQWSNTRDTAITLLALTDYLKASGELKAEGEYSVKVNGTEIAARKFTAKDVLNAPSRFVIDAKLLRDGANEIRLLRKAGESPLYFAAEATFFSLEEPVTAAANEIFARRQYYRLKPHPTLLKGNDYDRVLLKDGETINSGDRLEVSILVEAKNNYEYLLFEDLKPGGFEAVQIRSGEGAYARQVKTDSARRGQLTEDDYTSDTRWVYQEMRDRKVASFIDHLPQGFWELRYELRAETPGKFHALPTLGHAMYVPEIRCNTAEQKVEVVDAPKK